MIKILIENNNKTLILEICKQLYTINKDKD